MPRRRLREPFVFFVDECLGRHIVPEALRAAIQSSEQVVILPQGTQDLEWIPMAHQHGWVCFTKDRRLKQRPNELRALLGAEAATFMLGDAAGAEHAMLLTAALPTVRRILRVREVPLIARIERDGTLLVSYEGGERLPSPRRVEPRERDLAKRTKR